MVDVEIVEVFLPFLDGNTIGVSVIAVCVAGQWSNPMAQLAEPA